MTVSEPSDKLNGDHYVVLGNFDGVHRGHQFLLQRARQAAREQNCKLVVVTFYPHPKIFFKQVDRYYIADRLQNIDWLKRYCDQVYEIPFDEYCAQLSPADFLQQFIFSKQLKGIVIGHDFLFGYRQRGNSIFLKRYAEKYNLYFEQVGAYALNDMILSSTAIRHCLLKKDFNLIQKLLGRPYSITGKLITGKGLGRKINSPTLNLLIDEKLLLPPFGVYATRTLIEKQEYVSVTNIGVNPTVDKQKEVKIETHVIGQALPYYDHTIEVRVYLVSFLRAEKKFTSVRALQKQIRLDICHAQKVLGC